MGARVKYTACLVFLALLAIGAESGAYLLPPSQDTPKVVMHTPLGAITVELFPAQAPITVDNFLYYVNTTFYDELIVHRVINDPNFGLIQGGGYYGRPDLSLILYTYGLRDPIINESYNGLSNVRGTIAMAREPNDPDSATSQFYINTTDNIDLDLENDPCGYGYCVFGQVLEGMDVVDSIVQLPLYPFWVVGMNDVPNYHGEFVTLRKVQTRVYVATDGDDTDLGTMSEPFKTIQKGIDMSAELGHVAVRPGTYSGSGNVDLDLNGKPVTVRATRSNDQIVTAVIDCQGSVANKHRAFHFHSSEEPNSIIDGLTIINGYHDNGGAILCESSPTITNCTIISSTAVNKGGGICCLGGSPTIINCTLANNMSWAVGGALCCDNASSVNLMNSILWNNSASAGDELALLSASNPSTLSVSYSDIQDGRTDAYVAGGCYIDWGLGNLDLDPCFIDPENNEYHLSSISWQWTDANGWTFGTITSPCIDAGNPGSPAPYEYGYETNRINMGAFGGTYQASTPPAGWALLADINNDGFVDLTDYSYFARDFRYVGQLSPADLNRSATVGRQDLGLFADDWLKGTTWFWIEQADLNGDSIIDFKDFAALAENWLGAGEDITGNGWVDYDDIRYLSAVWLQRSYR